MLLGIFLIFIQFFIPFVILVVLYGQIVWMLSRRINTSMTDTKGNRDNKINTKNNNIDDTGTAGSKHLADTQRDRFQRARRNTINTLLVVGCCFIICWVQNQVLYLMYNLGYEIDWNSPYYHFTVLMVFVNCTVNPFIYLIKYQDYQIALKEFLHCKSKKRENITQHSVSSISLATNRSKA